MKKGQIRAIATCIFKKNDSILVCEGFDEFNHEYYYRPIGGGIEYGETSSNALKREVYEEIGAKITNVKFLGAIENIFTYNGDLGHEIVFVYDAEFVDKSFYERPSFMGCEDNGVPFKLYWKPICDFKNGKILLVPKELLNLL